MELKTGDILIKNGKRNSYVDFYNISEGDRFRVITPAYMKDAVRVMCMRTGRYLVMYTWHFKDSNDKIMTECIWRQYERR